MERVCPFVVLHHTGFGEPHYDFMVDPDGSSPLLTWRSPAWPIVDPSLLVPLPPHRREYLYYEGPVSNDRGEVRRIAVGQLVVEQLHQSLITIRLDERRMTIAVVLKS